MAKLTKEQNKAVQAFVENASVLLFDKSSSSKPAIRKLLNNIGIPGDRTVAADNYREAEDLIRKTRPSIVFCDFNPEPDKTALDLMVLHFENYPSRLGNAFIILSDKNSPAAAAKSAEEDADGMLLKPFTYDDLEDKFKEIILQKVFPSNYSKAIEAGKEKLRNKSYPEALEIFKHAKTLDPKPSLACYLEGEIKKQLGEKKEALACMEEGLTFNPSHYRCLANSIELYMEFKDYAKAYGVAKKLFDEYPANPKYIPNLVWLTIYHKDYEEILGLYESFIKIEPFDEVIASYVAAGLVVCGKYLLGEKRPKDAVYAFKRADSMMRSKPSIIKEILVALYSGGLFEEARDFLAKATDEVKNSKEILVAEFKFYEKSADANSIIQRGNELIRQGVKDPVIFELMLLKSISANRNKGVIDDLLSNAIQAFPDHKEKFEKLVSNSEISVN